MPELRKKILLCLTGIVWQNQYTLYQGTNDIPVKLKINEKYNNYAKDKDIVLKLNQTMSLNKIEVIPEKQNTNTNIVIGSLISDVDKDIPETSVKSPKRYALIIGNEDYTKNCPNPEKEPDVKYAANDAIIFSEYAEKTLGISKERITLITNANRMVMKKELTKFYTNIKLTNGQGEFLLYYSGHGVPDSTGNTYWLLPVDQTSMDIKDGGGFKISDIYTNLTKFPTLKTTVIWDACFSSTGLLVSKNKSGLKINPKNETSLLKGNIVIVASSQGTEPSQYDERIQHGVFTYYLLKKLKETKGIVTLIEMDNYLKQQVPLHLNNINKPLQNPEIKGAQELYDNWKTWKL